MALAGPVGKDNLDISFRLNSKAQVFNGATNVLMDAKVNICASASSLGIVFVGSNNPEIIVLCLKDLESPTALQQNAPIRRVPMPSPVTQIATNCDGSMLAVEVIINGSPIIQLYSVPSFLSPNIQKLREFRVSADNANAVQICWNPVINTTLAVCTASGGLNLYALKETGVEFHSIDPSLQAKCCCWSPKGKQIVAGFANGKLIQFNMELKSARVIECPPGIFPTGGSFETIAVQWLSTYQFAMALSSQQDETRPVIYILNAPKAGPHQYIAYSDACYSTSEVRPSRVYLQYIQQWGMILIASANCVDVSFLKISRPGDIPEWTQEFPNDQFPAELPLTPEKEESFPIGFELDTACQGRLLQEDGSPYPVMPMLHMLSTNGVLCSFYVFNTTQSYVDICSPPRPIDPRILSQFFKVSTTPSLVANKEENLLLKTPIPANPNPSPFSHSTPAASVKSNLFGSLPASTAPVASVQAQPPSNAFSGFNLLGAVSQPQPVISTPSSTFQFASKPIATTTSQETTVPQNKPLISIPPTYNPAANQSKPSDSVEKPKESSSADIEDDKVYMKIIQDEIKAFELEFNFVMEKMRSMKVRIGTKEESVEMRRWLEELDDLKKEAVENIVSLRCEVQANRLGITEKFAMLYEAKAKCEQDNKSLMLNKGQDRSTKRNLENLRKMVSHCDMQVQVVVQLLQSQWSNYQETVNKNKKNRMHIPSMEGVYQTLTKQQEIIYRLNGKLKLIKSRLGICDDVKKQKNANINSTIESLSDSLISISLADQVQIERAKLSDKKKKDLRNSLKGRKIVEIKPQRPQLSGLNSEIILEKKANALKSLKKKVEPVKEVTQKVGTQVTPKPIIQQNLPQSLTKTPSESIFNVGQISSQMTLFATPPVSQPIAVKKPEEPKPFSFASQPMPQQQPSFGLNTSSVQPSFSFSSTPLVLGAEKDKKKEEPIKLATQPQKSEPKLPSTISTTPVAVSANFSLPLTTPPKETSVVQEPKSQPLTSNETTSFTFSLPGKKETTAKPLFGATTQSTTVSSDSTKSAFSFGVPSATESSFSFGNLSKSEVKPSMSVTTTSSGSIFGSTPVTTSSSIFSGSFSLDSNKTPASITSPLQTTKDEPKIVEKTSPPSIFSSIGNTTVTAEAKPSSTFSFASFGTSITPTTSPPIATTASPSIFASPKSDAQPQILATVTQSKPADTVTVKTLLTGVNICSPELPAKADSTSPSNVFGSSSFSLSKSNTTSPSIFGNANASFGSAPKSVEVSSTAVSPIQNVTTTTSASPSIFGSSTTAPASSGSLFGSLSLGGTSGDQQSTNIFSAKPEQSVFGSSSSTNLFGSASSNIFGSAPQPASPPSNIFGSTTPSTQSSNIFAQQSSIFAQSTAAPTSTTSSGSIFSQNLSFPSTASSGTGIFGQSSSIFGSSAPAVTTSASIFGQSSSFQTASPFGTATSPSTQTGSNIFGGAATSPFGSSSGGSIFSSAANPGQPTFGGTATFGSNFGASGGSIFGQQQPTFGGGATFGSPKSNIFNSPPQSPQSNAQGNIFEQLGQQQGGGNLFGNLANQTQPPQAQQGFSGSAFSSWR